MSKLNYYYDKPTLTLENNAILEESRQSEKIKYQNNIITYGIVLLLITVMVVSYYNTLDRDYDKKRTD